MQTIFDYTEYYNNCDIDIEAFDILNTKMFKETISFEDVNLEYIL